VKISYKHIVRYIDEKPSEEHISKKLFQLGHEHTFQDGIFDIEITPNRGDCLSLEGILRDLSVFYNIDFNINFYQKNLQNYNFGFTNLSKEMCPKISFLKVEIDEKISPYQGDLKDYFNELDLKKNNFFTDISNYIMYELGQPTHCYDAASINDTLTLKVLDKDKSFQTLTDKIINLNSGDLVFEVDSKVINLAGVMGGKTSACDDLTRAVIIECAYFKPEFIIGKSLKYDIQSDAAYKFERGVDPIAHEKTLLRFLHLIQDHASIKSAEIYCYNALKFKNKFVNFDEKIINKILGTNISSIKYKEILQKLGFKIREKSIFVPSFRNDIENHNDISEEVARVIGYDNLPTDEINLDSSSEKKYISDEKIIKNYLTDQGFYEVINFPFDSSSKHNSIKLDNPLDSNKPFMRTNLKQSLINNLLFNERRQNDSIKLFEISDVYDNKNNVKRSRKLGIIASGRQGKNYEEFPLKIDEKYFKNIINFFDSENIFEYQKISRDLLNSKIKNEIFYTEIDFNQITQKLIYESKYSKPKHFILYKKISEFPSSNRDISFSIKKYENLENLQKIIFSYKSSIIKDLFIFDYYKNEKNNEIKIGFRFIFQSHEKTLKDKDINFVMDDIIQKSLSLDGVVVPGLKK
tara:strand:+ start:25090 stop:26997 length:1908 start_codon:yes stop_codon:yes gene_type:complete